MKTIHLKIEVPDGFVMPKKIVVAPAEDNSRDAMKAIEWKEIHLPTDEDINNYSKNVYPDCGQKTLNIQRRAFRRALTDGANFVINKLKSNG